MDDTTAARATADLIALLEVQAEAPDRFTGPRKPGGVGRVFGGQVLAQALAAAQRTVSADREPHSLHAYFLRGASEDHEIAFRVERDFDGRGFSNRRVVASQDGRPIFNMAASFHIRETGAEHQDELPRIALPESLESETALAMRPEYASNPGIQARQLVAPAVEVRPTEPSALTSADGRLPTTCNWTRVRAGLGEDRALHRAALTYISDLVLLGTALLPHLPELARSRVTAASLDHAIWFHQDFRADEWMLYATHSPWAGNARGFTRGQVFRRDGRLVATIAQEGLMRMAQR